MIVALEIVLILVLPIVAGAVLWSLMTKRRA